MKVDPATLAAEERSLVDEWALRIGSRVTTTWSQAYAEALEKMSPAIVARRAFFSPPEPAFGRDSGGEPVLRPCWNCGKLTADSHQSGTEEDGLRYTCTRPEPAQVAAVVNADGSQAYSAADQLRRVASQPGYDDFREAVSRQVEPQQPAPVAAGEIGTPASRTEDLLGHFFDESTRLASDDRGDEVRDLIQETAQAILRSQPALRMTEELGIVLEYAIVQCNEHDRGSPLRAETNHIRACVAAVRAQAAQGLQSERLRGQSEALTYGQSVVDEVVAAQGVKLEKTREALRAARQWAKDEYETKAVCAALAELDRVEGKA